MLSGTHGRFVEKDGFSVCTKGGEVWGVCPPPQRLDQN